MKTHQWDIQIIGETGCTNPTGIEGSTVCKDGFIHTCTNKIWVKNIPEKPCGGTECAQYLTQTECESKGCYWYAYPLPFDEPACFGKPIYIQYLPIIAVGIGTLIVAAALLSTKKSQYYPPPPYYPPPGGRY